MFMLCLALGLLFLYILVVRTWFESSTSSYPLGCRSIKMKRKTYYFWQRSQVISGLCFIKLTLALLLLLAMTNYEPRNSLRSASRDIMISKSGSIQCFNYSVVLAFSDFGFFKLNALMLQMFAKFHYTMVYLRARKSYCLRKRFRLYKIMEFSDHLRTLLLWSSVVKTSSIEMYNLVIELVFITICVMLKTICETVNSLRNIRNNLLSTLVKRNISHTTLFVIEFIILEFYVFPTAADCSAMNVFFGILYSLSYITRKQRNQLIHAYNGNPTNSKTGSITGNERATRTNPPRNSKSFVKTLLKTSNLLNLLNLSNSNLESNTNFKSNSNVNSPNLIRNIEFNDFDNINKNP
eukprot:1002370_1